MGGGSWTSKAFADYSVSTGKAYCSDGTIDYSSTSINQVFRSNFMDDRLNPNGVKRECRDSEEHPHTVPVILALDVTGSMGDAAKEVASKLHKIMEKILDQKRDVEFLIMGIGDLIYDMSPIQASQFESDIRIAEQLDLLYFENGGGGNEWESYTAAWYFGLHNTELDCWKRGEKGLIITIGDEIINPYLPFRELNRALGSNEQDGVKTIDLYRQVSDLYDVHHIHVSHGSRSEGRTSAVIKSFGKIIGDQNVHASNVNGLQDIIPEIVERHCGLHSDFIGEPRETLVSLIETPAHSNSDESGLISW